MVSSICSPFSWKFFCTHALRVTNGVVQTYWQSFEDALWEILAQKVQKDAVVLIPDFYCVDVIQNIEAHGYVVKLYACDANLQPNPRAFETARKRYRPQVIVLFHPVGIENVLLNNRAEVQRLASSALIIEDCVHRVIDSSKVCLLHQNHIIIDSLRKVTPLQGSFSYSLFSISSRNGEAQRIVDRLYTSILFFAFQFLYALGRGMRSNTLVRTAHERILKTHDAFVGDARVGLQGFQFVSKYLAQHLNHQLISNTKSEQVSHYYEQFREKGLKDPWYLITVSKEEWGRLHAFPIGFRGSERECAQMQKKIFSLAPLYWKFPDCAWSKNRRVLFLPLGLHVSDKEIDEMTSYFSSAQLRAS